MTAQGTEVTHNARAGVSNFGSTVALVGDVITCNGIDVDGEPDPDTNAPFSFDGTTGSQCSKTPMDCAALGACHALSKGISAPSALPGLA